MMREIWYYTLIHLEVPLSRQNSLMKTLFYKQKQKSKCRKHPTHHTIKTDNTGDPYPWLDADDPRRKMTDEEILRSKVPFDKSILSAAEKERLIKLMLENTPAFSIRDEIGTCPYFEVKLKLRDDKPFFVRPYNIREDQKPIIQKEMDRLEKLGIIRKGFNWIQFPSSFSKAKTTKLISGCYRLQGA